MATHPLRSKSALAHLEVGQNSSAVMQSVSHCFSLWCGNGTLTVSNLLNLSLSVEGYQLQSSLKIPAARNNSRKPLSSSLSNPCLNFQRWEKDGSNNNRNSWFVQEENASLISSFSINRQHILTYLTPEASNVLIYISETFIAVVLQIAKTF